ncbi:MAG: hypothetical protein SV487_04040 [Thermodesulfobacteriota bacterium]|nr:hypothetical protein [Thermodesulfobacteriota bacterium]
MKKKKTSRAKAGLGILNGKAGRGGKTMADLCPKWHDNLIMAEKYA